MTDTLRKYARPHGVAILILALLQACTPSYSYKEDAVPETVKLSGRLQTLFAKTKLVCFGRYALEVPLEAQLIMGPVWFPADVNVINGGLEAVKLRVLDDIKKIKLEDQEAEITYNGKGPVEASWQIRYYGDVYDKQRGSLSFNTYVNKGDVTFIIMDIVSRKTEGKRDTEEAATSRQAQLAKNVRLRMSEEVPDEDGFCFGNGFISDKSYSGQETASAGIYLPSFPDVTFSVTVQPLCGKRDRITVEGPEQNLKHAMALLA
ncbi:hypothetical protein ACFDR9_005634 [Janthinobacterium sp. CG_23.3]|uniref:T6SS immunity protein Tli4 family protein n=1 Tax=Janthinobacterium sp. CG_23.3 TaxID=3349634 RepID=UPI0038D4B136